MQLIQFEKHEGDITKAQKIDTFNTEKGRLQKRFTKSGLGAEQDGVASWQNLRTLKINDGHARWT